MAEGGFIGVKCRANGLLETLKDCSWELSSEERSEFVSTVREMLGVLETGVNQSSEERSDLVSTVREMLSVLETGENREEGESRSKRTRSDAGICTHVCVHHPEIVDRELWSKLSEDLVELVFARLPIPRIIELRKSSKAWTAMSDSGCFKGAFAKVNPKMFGLLGWDYKHDCFRTRVLDAAFKEWHAIDLDFFKGKGHKDSLYACDSGLVCLLLDDGGCSDCVFVGNPLTGAWRKLPRIPLPLEVVGSPIMVQLVTNELFYRVILVYKEKLNNGDAETNVAFVYDSGTGSWSVMSSGLVYGSGDELILGSRNIPLVFDCVRKQLFYLRSCAAIQELKQMRCSVLKDRVFVLHVLIVPGLPGNNDTQRYVISEFTWENSRSDLRKVRDYEVASKGKDVEIFTNIGVGFIVAIWDEQPFIEYGSDPQFDIGAYDVSAGRWRDLPPLFGDSGVGIESLQLKCMCELRWDADPCATTPQEV